MPQADRPEVTGHDAEPERTCPSPGGCESCPEPMYCAGLRVGIGLTTVRDEFGDTNPIYGDLIVIDSSTPIEEEYASSEEEE